MTLIKVMKTVAGESLKVDGNRHLNGMKIDSNALKVHLVHYNTQFLSIQEVEGQYILSSGTRRTDCI